MPEFSARMEWYLQNRPQLAALISNWQVPGSGNRQLLSLLRGHRMKALLKRMLDETRFLSDYGVRSISKAHEREPFSFPVKPVYEVGYWQLSLAASCSAATQTGAVRSGCRSTSYSSSRCKSSTTTTATISKWSADRVRPVRHHQRRRRRTGTPSLACS